jgi:hypothetical protein
VSVFGNLRGIFGKILQFFGERLGNSSQKLQHSFEELTSRADSPAGVAWSAAASRPRALSPWRVAA